MPLIVPGIIEAIGRGGDCDWIMIESRELARGITYQIIEVQKGVLIPCCLPAIVPQYTDWELDSEFHDPCPVW
jgi:hypothetical protein